MNINRRSFLAGLIATQVAISPVGKLLASTSLTPAIEVDLYAELHKIIEIWKNSNMFLENIILINK